jgi:hypothetical protein
LGAIVTTGKMKPLGGGSVRQVAIGITRHPGLSATARAQVISGEEQATDYLLVGSRAIEWRSWVAESDRQTLFMQPRVGEE